MKSKRIILTGGGTGGHVWPLIVIAEELRRQLPVKFLYLGSTGIEKTIVPKFYPFKPVATGKWRRYASIGNFSDLVRLMVGIIQAWLILRGFKPDLILAKGGYVSLPVIVAAKLLSIPLVIHETDAVMGKTNQYAAKISKLVFTGFPVEFYPKFLADKLIYTGTPVRQEFFRRQAIKSIDTKLKLNPRLPICLVMGGSQGASAINSLIMVCLSELLDKTQIIHLTGRLDYIRCLNKKSRLPKDKFNRYYPIEFAFRDLPSLMNLVDVIVSRAGGTALAEIAAMAKPAIIIPLPKSAGDHQSVNAKWYADYQAIVVLSQSSLTPEKLKQAIVKLIKDKNRQGQLSAAIGKLAPRNSVSIIISKLVKLLTP